MRMMRMEYLSSLVVCVLSLVPASVGAQTPTSAAGRQNPTAPNTWTAPRTPDGQPDMQGLWRPGAQNASHSLEEGAEPANRRIGGATNEEIARELANQPVVIVEPADRRIPYQAWAAAKRTENLQNLFAPTELKHIEPEDRCLSEGVPRINYRGVWQVVQVPGYVVFLFEWTHGTRVIPIDGGLHIGKNIKLWNGDSRGHWEGNTLVVDVTNHNGETWFDSHGSFHSDGLHVVERFTLADADTINYEATIEDPSVFTRPWKIAFTVRRNQQKGYALMEEACYEGDRNSPHMLEVGRALKAAGVTGIHTHKE